MSSNPDSLASDSEQSTRSATRRSAAAASNADSSSATVYSSSQFHSSLLASQPADHLLIINRFLDATETIRLFRCSRRLYDLPLHYRVELGEFELGRYRHGKGRLVESGRDLANCRFCVTELWVNEYGKSGQSWNPIQDAMQLNSRLFSSLKYIVVCFKDFSHTCFDPSRLPRSLEYMEISFSHPALLAEIAPNLAHLTNLKSLSFYCDTELESIPPIVCPSLEHLTLGCDQFDPIDQIPFSASLFPASLRTLDLSLFFCTSPIPPLGSLTALEDLHLPHDFDQPLTPDFLPASLKSLNLGCVFNQPIQVGSLPPGLEILTLNEDCDTDETTFNHPLVPGSLPPKLRVLHLSRKFNHPLTRGVLPNGLIELHFPNHSSFNQPFLPGSLPASLTELKFGWYSLFNQPFLPGALPSSLVELRFGKYSSFDQPFPFLPGVLPSGLKILELKSKFNQPLLGSLPVSLISFCLGAEFNHPIQPGCLPPALELLDFHDNSKFNHPLLPGSLPASLKTIRFGRDFNQPLPPGILPSLLTELQFERDSQIDQSLAPGSLPAGLQMLQFGLSFNRPLPPGVLPASLTELKFFSNGQCNHPFQPGSLPPNLRTMYLGLGFSHPLFPDILPSSLRSLALNSIDFFPLPLSSLPHGLELTVTPPLSAEEIEELPMYSVGQVVQLVPEIAAALESDTDSRFQVIDNITPARRQGSSHPTAFLIEQLLPESSQTDHPCTDSVASALRYWVSPRHLQPAESHQSESDQAAWTRKRTAHEPADGTDQRKKLAAGRAEN